MGHSGFVVGKTPYLSGEHSVLHREIYIVLDTVGQTAECGMYAVITMMCENSLRR